MSLDIGGIASAIAALPPAGGYRPDRPATFGDRGGENAPRLIEEPEAPPVRVGFGENTLSPSGAALRTLDRNLEAASELVPTVQELRERARFNQAARPDAIESRTTPPRETEPRQPESVRPEPNPAAREFVAGLGNDAPDRPNDAAATPGSTPAPTEAPAPEAPPGPQTRRLDLQA